MNGQIHDYLAQGHARLDALFARGLAGDVAAYEEFRAGLLRHIAMEEKVLFAAARKHGVLRDMVDLLHADHAALASLMVPSPTPSLLRVVREVLDEHNPIEEAAHGLYNACDELTSVEATDALARLIAIPPARVSQHVDEPRIHEHIARMLAARRKR